LFSHEVFAQEKGHARCIVPSPRGLGLHLPEAPHPAVVHVRLHAERDARSDSDLDLLVEFEPHAKPGLIGMARIEIELSSLLNGRKVDLRTAQDLSRYFRDEVLRTATPQYAA
jgi:hypothetical protein